MNIITYNHTASYLFESQVDKTPLNIAVNYNGVTYTYKTLNEKANQFAFWLLQQNVVPGAFVGVLLDPGIDFIVSILAIIKVGAVYLPLDALAPSKRLNDILNDANPKLVITNEQYLSSFNKSEHQAYLVKNIHLSSLALSKNNVELEQSPASPIYMMYTSGSTGRPKGVIIPHHAVVNLAKVDNYAMITAEKSIAQFSNVAFDASTFEIWSAFLNGATLTIIPAELRQDHNKLKLFFDSQIINYIFLPTGFFHQLIKSAPDTLNKINVVIFGGEQVNANLLKNFIDYRKKNELPITLINGYGPTEATTFTCRHILDEQSVLRDEQLSSIGKPIKNTLTYILDENGSPSDEGELCISGINLAIGYHNCPVQNKEKFIKNPFATDTTSQQLYKTGDKVRRLSSGDLVCLGRLDDQVKIGGFRIHLNEIERQLMQYPSISLAAVKVEIGGGSHQLLAAYLVAASDKVEIHADDIRHFLSETLPPYMLPAKYILIKEMPLTLVGKVDKDKLVMVEHTDLSLHIEISSSSRIEEQIKKVWQDLLNRQLIDVNKNLFELGANSLLLTEACVRINEALQSDIQISTILSHPTIHKLSRYLEGDIERSEVKVRTVSESSDIAIIGMSCRFPEANSIEEFWDNLCAGKESLTRFNQDELAAAGNAKKTAQENFVPVRGILADIDQFDANFFRFNPVDASITDPQQRLFLECAWEALEHAGVAPSKIGSNLISVFAGMADSTYLPENLAKSNWVNKELDRFQQRIANSIGMLSTQVSYRLNLKGRSLNINTACSTGLVTVAEACRDLMLGSSDIALAGAVSITVPQIDGYIYQAGSIESSDGKCRPFASDADGTVFSNGVGVVVLKRLADAIADNDTIFAVIKGYGVNNDGSDKLGYTAPSTSGQISCISEALTQAAIPVEDIGFVEAHGTATVLGDVIEMEALTAVYGAQTEKKQFCTLGSVKGNIGHTDVSAGIAGIIKTALCLYYHKIPPTLHFDKPNPNIDFNSTPFFINTELMDWKRNQGLRHAGVSAFGVGGTNVHMILSEHPKASVATHHHCEQLFTLSAKTEQALKDNTQALIQYLSSLADKTDTNHLAQAAYTLQTGREDFPWRATAVGKSAAEMIESLKKSQARLCNEETRHNVVFMFPGQGMQYHMMAAELMQEIPNFALWVNKGVDLAKNYLQCDLLEIIQNPADERLNQTQYAQPALFIIEYALAKLLISYGIIPSALIGHSLGEYVAACLAGVFSYEDAIALICDRGLLMASAPSGEMLAIECTVEAFTEYMPGISVELALHNATNHCVASGDAQAIQQLEAHLSALGVSYQKLKVSHAFHSRLMDNIEVSFKAMLSNVSLAAPTMPIVSNLTGDWLSAKDATDPEYWYKHLRHTVQLSLGLECLLKEGQPFFIEVGPGHTLSFFLQDVARQHKQNPCIAQLLPCFRRHHSDMHQLLLALGDLWKEGVDIQWDVVHENEKRGHIPLPTYAFQKQSYWIEPDLVQHNRQGSPLIYKPVWSHQRAYVRPTPLLRNKLSEHTWIIFKDTKGIANQLIATLKKQGVEPIVIGFNKTYLESSPSYFQMNFASPQHYLKLMLAIKNNIQNPIMLHAASYTDWYSQLPSAKQIEDQLDLSFYSILYLTQAYLEVFGVNVSLKVGVITSGTQQLLGSETMNPVNATLAGSCRVIMQEHESLKLRVVDLNSAEQPEHNENLLNKVIESCVNEEWSLNALSVPYRNGFEWKLMYGLVKTPQEKGSRLKNNGVYLLTGGLGGIALSCCEAIATTVSTPKFVLLFRSQMPMQVEWDDILQDPTHAWHKKIKKIRELESLGAECYFYQVDIAERKSLEAVIEQCVRQFGTINGLIHAAGVSNTELVQLKSKRMAQAVFSAKIYGTYHLVSALKNISLDFVVLKSSLAALLGGFGQVDYAGANASLDAFVEADLFSFASFVTSINWNTWQEVGIAAEAALKGEANFLGQGNDISPEEGKKLFLEVLQGNDAHVAISNTDMSLSDVKVAPHTNKPKLQKMLRENLSVVTSYAAPTTDAESKLCAFWQEALGIEQIGINDDFFSLGGHSLMALSLIQKINQAFKCTLPTTYLYRHSTIKELSAALLSDSEDSASRILVPMKIIEQSSPYLFLCHPISGVVSCFNSFVSQSELPLSIYGLQDPSIDKQRMEYDSLLAMSEDYLASIQKVQPTGPYYLIGYSFGGNVLYEVANLLKKQGQDISLFAMIDSWAINSHQLGNENDFRRYLQALHGALPEQMLEQAWMREQLLLKHTFSEMNQEMVLFKAVQLYDAYKGIDHSTNGWSDYNKGNIVCHLIDGNHDSIMNTEHSKNILDFIKQRYFRGVE